ncbi:MAG: hypothetical protein FWE31_02480 [Firmicutes bacterium]|nr:hypothetical protein [Bacillota bacterium]
MAKYFGTDGLRGRVGEDQLLNKKFVTSLATAIATYAGKGLVLIGRDTRLSGEWIEDIFIQVLTNHGIEVKSLGVVPTTALSYITSRTEATLGVVITASHNPEPWNGIKLFCEHGRKLRDEEIRKIERRLEC